MANNEEGQLQQELDLLAAEERRIDAARAEAAQMLAEAQAAMRALQAERVAAAAAAAAQRGAANPVNANGNQQHDAAGANPLANPVINNALGPPPREPLVEFNVSSLDQRSTLDFDVLETAKDYPIWAHRMEDALEESDLWGYVSGAYPRPDGIDIETLKTWQRKDSQAMRRIRMKVHNKLYPRLIHCTSAKDTWAKLQKMYKLEGGSGEVDLINKWTALTVRDGGDVREYIAKQEDMRAEANRLGFAISDAMATVYLFRGLPPSWRDWVHLNSGPLTQQGGEGAFDRAVQAVESQIIVRETTASASKQRDRDHRHKSKPARVEEKSYLIKEEDATCYNCGKKGHYARNCRSKPNPNAVASSSKLPQKQPQRGKAHAAPESDSDEEKEEKVKKAFHGGKSKKKGKAMSTLPGSRDVSLAAGFQPLLENGKAVRLLDCGASNHTFADRSYFHSFSEAEGSMGTANGGDTKIMGVGSVKCKTVVDGVERTLTFNDVYYIPGFADLISLGQLKAKGVSAWFPEDEAYVHLMVKGETVMRARDYGKNLFSLDAEFLPALDQADLAAATVRRGPALARAWHRKLGHPSDDYLKALVRAGIIGDITEGDVDALEKCTTCAKGKAKRSVFPASSSRATKPLELVHSDVCGPFKTSIGKSKYYVTFLDDHSRYCWAYPIAKKSDVFDVFVLWRKKVQTELGAKLRTLHTDNGGEYCSKAFEQYLARKGVRHTTTVAETPQQNGRAESLNNVLNTKVTCLLVDSGLGGGYWAEALLTAAYLRNRTPCEPVGMKTPYEVLYGRPPALDRLQIFGAKAEALNLPKRPGSKHAERTTSVTFMGYSEDKKAWRVRDKDGRLFSAVDVVFFPSPPVNADADDLLEVEDYSEGSSVSSSTESETESESGSESDSTDESSVWSEDDDLPKPAARRHLDDDDEDIVPARVHPLPRDEPRPAAVIEDPADDHEDEDNAEPDHAPDRDPSPPPPPPPEPLRERVPGAPVITRSGREVHRPARYQDGAYAALGAYAIRDVVIPQTYEEAVSGPDAPHWVAAMDTEIENFEAMEVWTVVDRPVGRKVTGCKWVYDVKRDAEGKIIRYKARLVAQGFSQVQGLDYNVTYCPVSKAAATKIVLVFINHYDLEVIQGDFTTAFLNGDMEEELYMKPPPGYDVGNKVCLIQKALYGFKQSARSWYRKLDDKLQQLAFYPLEHEPCLYVRHAKGRTTIFLVYVDDFLVAGEMQDVRATVDELKLAFKLEERGDLTKATWLGMTVVRDRKTRTIKLNLSRYIQEALERFGMDKAHPLKMPIERGQQLATAKEGEAIDREFPYREAIGTLIYLSTCYRSDVAFACGVAARQSNARTEVGVGLVKRILQYLKGTKDLEFVIEFKPDADQLEVTTDADHAGDQATAKSTTGGVVEVFGNPVIWISKRQGCVSRSTLESELVSASVMSVHLLWVKYVLEEMGYVVDTVPMYMDNTATIDNIEKGAVTDRTKHIATHNRFVHELYKAGTIELRYIRSKNNKADLFTKGFGSDELARLRTMVGLK